MVKQLPPLLILGSARGESTTRVFAQQLFGTLPYAVLDLLEYSIAPYNYQYVYPPEDDFLALAKRILQHQIIVFATPVYWYAMSGTLKIFFDRLTDLTTVQKNLGHRLAGKKVLLVATGSDAALPPGFEVPFELTAAYLHMPFAGTFYSSAKAVLASRAADLQPEFWAALGLSISE